MNKTCDVTGCLWPARWVLVAGTSKCPAIIEGYLCEEHKTWLTGFSNTNIPHSMSDEHGHRMEEAMIARMGADAAPLVYVNDVSWKCRTCGSGFPVAEEAAECAAGHAATGPMMPRCGECGRTYATVTEAADCALRDRAREHECASCGRKYADRTGAQGCCRSWTARRVYESVRRGMRNAGPGKKP